LRVDAQLAGDDARHVEQVFDDLSLRRRVTFDHEPNALGQFLHELDFFSVPLTRQAATRLVDSALTSPIAEMRGRLVSKDNAFPPVVTKPLVGLTAPLQPLGVMVGADEQEHLSKGQMLRRCVPREKCSRFAPYVIR